MSDISDEDEIVNVETMPMNRYIPADYNPFRMSDGNFIESFALSKDAFKYLLLELKQRMAIVPSPVVVLSSCLWFISHGYYNKTEEFIFGLDKSTLITSLGVVFALTNELLVKKWIKFEVDPVEINKSKKIVYERSGFPGVIGFIDGFDVILKNPPPTEKQLYTNEIGFQTMKVWIYCDYKMYIRYVNAEIPGSQSNAVLWKTSHLRLAISNRHLETGDNLILGTTDFPADCFMVPPVEVPTPDSPEEHYNNLHFIARKPINNLMGNFKARYRCLNSPRAKYFSHVKLSYMVCTCCVLYNIMEQFKLFLHDTSRDIWGDAVDPPRES